MDIKVIKVEQVGLGWQVSGGIGPIHSCKSFDEAVTTALERYNDLGKRARIVVEPAQSRDAH